MRRPREDSRQDKEKNEKKQTRLQDEYSSVAREFNPRPVHCEKKYKSTQKEKKQEKIEIRIETKRTKQKKSNKTKT